MTNRFLLTALTLTSLLTACSPEGFLGTIAGPQVEAAFYEQVRTELSGQGMAKGQIDCIVTGLQQKITAQDVLAGSTAAGMDKIKQTTIDVTSACVANQQPTSQTN